MKKQRLKIKQVQGSQWSNKTLKNWKNGYFLKKSEKTLKSQGKQEKSGIVGKSQGNVWTEINFFSFFSAKFEILSLVFLNIIYLIKNYFIFTVLSCFS